MIRAAMGRLDERVRQGILAAAVLLGLACGSRSPVPGDPDATGMDTGSDAGEVADSPASDAFLHRVITRSIPQGRQGVATGSFTDPGVEYPAMDVDPRYTHVLNFRMAAFAPPLMRPIRTYGPIVLYDDDLNTIVVSPMDHVFETVMWFEGGRIRSGVQGELDEVPPGWTHRFLWVEGKGVNATVEHWGDRILADRGRGRTDRYADAGLSYLGYWTDNGAAYYYHVEPGLNEEDTLLAVKAEADEQGIPYGYFQIDSWWYVKAPGETPFAPGGTLLWEPRPEAFPDGLAAFQDRLGLPLVAHNRWFAPDTPYRDRHDFVDGDGLAFPTGPGVFEEMMDHCVEWGIETYEQDWYSLQWWRTPWLRQTAGRGDAWMRHIHEAASARGVTEQLCMAEVSHLLSGLDFSSVTTMRTSVDYKPDLSKETFWPQFHTTGLLAWAVGVWPFKDNFWSSERRGEQEALISVLSGGMVGVGDGLGRTVRDIVMRTCRADGLLLKPDRPATPIDRMFLPHARPFLTAAWSRRPGLGRWTYVAAYHLASEHPERTVEDRLWAELQTDPGFPVEDMFVFPEHVTDWHLDLAEDLGLAGRFVVFDWRRGEGFVPTDGRFEMTPFEHLYDFAYYVVAPVLDNGLALIGETDKYVTLADRRFQAVVADGDALRVTVAGVPGEHVTLRAWDADAGALLPPMSIAIGADGRGEAVLRR